MNLVNKISTTLLVIAALASVASAKVKPKLEIHLSKGTMTDPRDGTIYNTVMIDNQIWMAENLDYKVGASWCYENNPEKCVVYGRLYNWVTAKSVCPVGWKLPSDHDWEKLLEILGDDAQHLKSGDMQGTDSTGFEALPAGDRNAEGVYDDIGGYATFWTSTENDSTSAWKSLLSVGDNQLHRGVDQKVSGFSVRCIKE